MAKYIELIDKYIVRQDNDTGYNPPSYIWTDNTGEIVRCCECKHRSYLYGDCARLGIKSVDDDFFCRYGEREVQE